MSILDALLYKSFGPVFIKENSDAESFIEKMKALSSKASGKVKDKIDVINHLLEKVDNLIIGGGLSYTFTKAQGHEVGTSLLEEDKIDLAKSFINTRREWFNPHIIAYGFMPN